MTVWHPTDDGQAQLTDHDAFAKGAPHNTFARLRRDDPMHWTDWDGGKGFWSVTRHADILALNRQSDLLSSAQGIRIEDQSDKALAAGSFDATKEIARELPMRMLGRILGTPDEDLPWLVDKGDALMANTDPDFTDHVMDKLDTDAYRLMPFNSPAGAELYDYADTLMQRKAAAGDTSGILHMIRQPGPDGTCINEREFKNFFCLLVAAGNDTTRYSIAAGIQALCIIRWASPATYFRRTATRDFEMHGKTVKAGDKVVYWFISGNRDAEAFDDPFRVNLGRSPNKHVAFGQGGPHVCLGMWLARLEVRILFQELARRITSIEPAGEAKFLRSNFVSGIKNLPVKVQLA